MSWRTLKENCHWQTSSNIVYNGRTRIREVGSIIFSTISLTRTGCHWQIGVIGPVDSGPDWDQNLLE